MLVGRGIPLIRAAALVPLLGWLEVLGAPVHRHLGDAHLSYFPHDQPDRPIAFLSAIDFATAAAHAEGIEDLGCRVVGPNSLQEIGLIGQIALSSQSVREALQRVGSLMRNHSSHEQLMVVEEQGNCAVLVRFPRAALPAQLHIAEQYTVMLLKRLFEAVGCSEPLFKRIEFIGRPAGGYDLLRPWFGDQLVTASRPVLRMTLADGVIDRRFPRRMAPEPSGRQFSSWVPLGPGLSVHEASSLLVETMLLDRVPEIEEVALVSGMSVRTLQRRLHDEGTSFSGVLDGLRRSKALEAVLTRSSSMAWISSSVGYGSQASFTRAFRRWTSESPRRLRQRATGT